jgi:hypothetical protein
MYTHIYIWAHQAIRMFTYKKYIGPQASATSRYKNRLTSLSKRYTIYIIHQGASIAPPAAPPSGGGGGPPPPAPGGGGGTPAGPSCPGGRRPLVIAASTAARRTIPRHGGGTILCTTPGTPHPGYGSTCPQAHPVTPSPDDDVCHQNQLWLPPEEHVMVPAPGSSNRRLLAALSGVCWGPRSLISSASLSTRQSLRLSLNRRSLQLHLAPMRCHICTCTKQQTNDYISIYHHTYELIYQNIT